MDLIKKLLEQITIGYITTRWDLVIYRAGKDAYVIGPSIKLRNDRLTMDEAVQTIYNLTTAKEN